MNELEKLEKGLDFCFIDKEVAARKTKALMLCKKFNDLDARDISEQEAVIRELFGSVGKNVSIQPNFNCDYGKNIYVGDEFLTNYNVTILDIAPIHIGDYVMIGPNTLISTVGHPTSPAARRKRMANSKPITIGNDVWIGGNCTILPGVTIGNNVIVAAGAVVTKNIPDNCMAAGIPARFVRELENDIK